MELVGRYLSVVEDDRGIILDFRCTNKEIIRDILVPPALRAIPSGLLRIFCHRPTDPDTGMPRKYWVLNHVEEME